MKKRFLITYEVITEESASHGEVAYEGFLPKDKEIPSKEKDGKFLGKATIEYFCLRECHELLVEGSCGVSPLEPNCYPFAITESQTAGKLANIRSNISDFWDGLINGEKQVSLTMHIPETVSPASRFRIARIFGLL